MHVYVFWPRGGWEPGGKDRNGKDLVLKRPRGKDQGGKDQGGYVERKKAYFCWPVSHMKKPKKSILYGALSLNNLHFLVNFFFNRVKISNINQNVITKISASRKKT